MGWDLTLGTHFPWVGKFKGDSEASQEIGAMRKGDIKSQVEPVAVGGAGLI
jgi:hypothetical protein